jgi:hypothetical protein
MIFLYALKAPATREKYIQRLTKFLHFLVYQGTKEEKARTFADQARRDPICAFNSVLKFFQSKHEQIERGFLREDINIDVIASALVALYNGLAVNKLLLERSNSETQKVWIETIRALIGTAATKQ